jgi:hypothetical protein
MDQVPLKVGAAGKDRKFDFRKNRLCLDIIKQQRPTNLAIWVKKQVLPLLQ